MCTSASFTHKITIYLANIFVWYVCLLRCGFKTKLYRLYFIMNCINIWYTITIRQTLCVHTHFFVAVVVFVACCMHNVCAVMCMKNARQLKKHFIQMQQFLQTGSRAYLNPALFSFWSCAYLCIYCIHIICMMWWAWCVYVCVRTVHWLTDCVLYK